jgi:hypothetical protein
MSHAPATDYKAIGDIYRNRLGGPPFPITQDVPRKALMPCGASLCSYVYDPNDGTSRGQCAGYCSGC